MIRNASIAVLALAVLLPIGAARADDQCEHSAPRSLALDYAGVRTVKFSIGQHKLKLDAAPATRATVSGRACASSAKLLPQLLLTSEKRGDVLLVSARRDGNSNWSFGNNYAYMTLTGTVPANVAVEMAVGSGDAWIDGVASLKGSVGSGDLEAKRVRGATSITVGSGDAEFDDIGSLDVGSIGSGDVKARRVRAGVKVGSIGSGDLQLDGVGTNVDIGSIGSGDADVKNVKGNVTLSSIGSGDLDVDTVGGNVVVRSKGSGSVTTKQVSGSVDVPKR